MYGVNLVNNLFQYLKCSLFSGNQDIGSIKIDPNIAISDSRRIVDLRNWVIHGYDKVDDVIIWGILSRDIPKLKKQVKKLIRN